MYELYIALMIATNPMPMGMMMNHYQFDSEETCIQYMEQWGQKTSSPEFHWQFQCVKVSEGS